MSSHCTVTVQYPVTVQSLHSQCSVTEQSLQSHRTVIVPSLYSTVTVKSLYRRRPPGVESRQTDHPPPPTSAETTAAYSHHRGLTTLHSSRPSIGTVTQPGQYPGPSWSSSAEPLHRPCVASTQPLYRPCVASMQPVCSPCVLSMMHLSTHGLSTATHSHHRRFDDVAP